MNSLVSSGFSHYRGDLQKNGNIIKLYIVINIYTDQYGSYQDML